MITWVERPSSNGNQGIVDLHESTCAANINDDNKETKAGTSAATIPIWQPRIQYTLWVYKEGQDRYQDHAYLTLSA